jgi:D-alanine-D-alanine ligase-like ATP-grasp enzyme
MKEKSRSLLQNVHTITKMKGFSREAEFIIVNDEPFMLEMNTVPGCEVYTTTTSLSGRDFTGRFVYKCIEPSVT